jgi:CRISPR-associated protein (TIGR03984 family)
MNKKIKLTSVTVDSGFAKGMQTWLEAKVNDLQSTEIYLLSFHDDGVVWGKIKGGKLLTSDNLSNSPSPEFRTKTLQELRLFGEKGQLHVWRIGETQFKASLALDGETGEYELLLSEEEKEDEKQEEQVLYGTDYVSDNGEFMIVRDGSEGLRHAFPIVDASKFDSKKRPLRLKVNHYIEYDQDGCARIAYSRLVKIGCGLDLGEN